MGLVPCGKLCYPAEDTPEGRESAYRATFEMSKEPWRWAFNTNIILDSVILRRYDDSIPAPVRKFAATVPEGDWEAMEAPDFIGINLYNGDMVMQRVGRRRSTAGSRAPPSSGPSPPR